MLLPDLILSGSIECQAMITKKIFFSFIDPSADDEARETVSDIIDRTSSGGKHQTKAFHNSFLKKCINNTPRCGGESAEEQ
ncbi:hypothetical protein BDV36DRAFT_287464 [Aspergillus pseudocaelatus]|uniref:Uncharacterized protein n=1 Tax=Aspergillus pseudocaelatus TaxID=1825620 RepID=A0ABQ6W6Y3_9EURO|nr:hypothetical protein BDV36DRAFT_287464 [Aspergillus pseudocaelatus]